MGCPLGVQSFILVLPLTNLCCMWYHGSVWCHYKAVKFVPNLHKIHPICQSPISDMDYMDLNVCCLRKAIKLNHSLTHPLGWDIEYLLWVQTQIYILFLSLQWCMQCHVTSDCITTTLTLYWTLLFMLLWSMTILYTVRCRYNMVLYNMILHAPMQ